MLACAFLSLALTCADAHAWGLTTHAFFAQSLVWAVPITLPAFALAARNFPAWVVAGACLPDLSLFGRGCGTEAFATNHQWETAQRLLAAARCDRSRAAALGYASHLLVDVVAHNHFVPRVEARVPRVGMLTHAFAEWAMDAHLARQIMLAPARALREPGRQLADYVSDGFACPRNAAEATLAKLARWEGVLRASRLPQMIYAATRGGYRAAPAEFDDYVARTTATLAGINQLAAGGRPHWHPENRSIAIPPLGELCALQEPVPAPHALSF